MAECDCPYRPKGSFCIFPECEKRGRRRRQFNHESQKTITVGDQTFFQRSSWEGNFARVLEWHRSAGMPFRDYEVVTWKHEPQTFYFDPERAARVRELYGRSLKGHRKGATSYKPDFGVGVRRVGGEEMQPMLFPDEAYETVYFEVKGFMIPKDRTKIKRFGQYYPDHTLIVIDAQWFKMNARRYRSLIPEWETMTF